MSNESNGPLETSTSSTEIDLRDDDVSGIGISPGEKFERDLDRGLPSQTEDSDSSSSSLGSFSGRDPLRSDRDLSLDVLCLVGGPPGGCQGGGSCGGLCIDRLGSPMGVSGSSMEASSTSIGQVSSKGIGESELQGTSSTLMSGRSCFCSTGS